MQPGEELSLPLGCAGNCGRGTPTPCRWNLLVGALVTDATIVQYDGHPSWPNGDALWRVPDAVVQVCDIPRTLNGKKMEVPVRKLLLGAEVLKVASPDTMQNPASLDFFVEYAKTIECSEAE